MNDRPDHGRDESEGLPDDNELTPDQIEPDDYDLDDDIDDQDDVDAAPMPRIFDSPPSQAAARVEADDEELYYEADAESPEEETPLMAEIEPDDEAFEEEEEEQLGPAAAVTAAERIFAPPSPTGSRSQQDRPRATAFTVFRPESTMGALQGAGRVVLCLVLGLALLYKGLSHDPSLNQLWPLLISALFLFLAFLYAYWTWCSFSLSYIVDRNSLSIRWGAIKQIIPLVNIERLIPASQESDSPDIQGIDWKGHHVGKADVPTLGEVLFYSGHRAMGDVLYVQTPSDVYAISVPDPVTFARAVQSNQTRGPLFDQRQSVHREGIALQSFWLDQQARFLTLLLLGSFVVVLAYVLQTYPDLSQSVALRFPSLGNLVRVADKSELLDIPRSAAAFLGVNLLLAVLLHPWERMVSIVLLLAGIAIQIALLVAAIVAVA